MDKTQTNTWIKSQLTVQNLLLVVVATLAVGGWIKTSEHKDEALAARLSSIEVIIADQEREVKTTYERRDVLAERLRAIDDSLRRIEARLITIENK